MMRQLPGVPRLLHSERARYEAEARFGKPHDRTLAFPSVAPQPHAARSNENMRNRIGQRQVVSWRVGWIERRETHHRAGVAPVERTESRGKSGRRYLDFASARSGHSLPQFENVCAFNTLTGKRCDSTHVSQFWRPSIKQTAKKAFVRSKGWRRPAEFLEFVPRDELKEGISLILRDVNR